MAYTYTKDGKVEAPSWYRNDDGSTPSTMQKGLTEAQWKQQNASRIRKKETEAKQAAAKEKATAYLANHPNKGQGGTKDAGYNKILKQGGLTNHQYQQSQRAEQNQKLAQQKVERKKSAAAYKQSRKDLQAAKAKHGPAGHYGMQSALDNQSVAKVGKKYAHSGDLSDKQADRNALVRTFQNSGYDYSHDEVQRSLNDGAYQQQNSWIYDQYGGGKEGWKNWRDNYSIYGGEKGHNRESFMAAGKNVDNYTYDLGNFKGSQDIMAFDKVMEIGRKKQQAGRDFYNSQEFKDKYGEYDWAKFY